LGPAKALEQGLIPVKDYNRVKQCINAYHIDKQEPYEHDQVRGLWLWGESGSGKSWDARHKYSGGTFYIKAQNIWWDGYNGEETVILDDLDETHPGHNLKIWMDMYSNKGQTKGGHVNLTYKRFIVTSNYSIEELFADKPKMIVPIQRRCKVIHYSTPYKGLPVVHTV
jgi:hypothetical protein